MIELNMLRDRESCTSQSCTNLSYVIPSTLFLVFSIACKTSIRAFDSNSSS